MQKKKQDDLLNSNYDGIQEYDNNLPRWWVILFYITILFAVVYYGMYLLGGIPSSEERLANELALIAERKPKQEEPKITEEILVSFLADSEKIANGKDVYVARCAACHGGAAEGLVGPNLTDEYWIHGGKLLDIRHTIEVGVLEKGMLSWKGVISDDEITNVALYIRSIAGTNPANPKAPEGEKVIDG